jgi:hypothetical protein
VAECTRPCPAGNGAGYSRLVPPVLPLAAEPALGPFIVLLLVGLAVGVLGHLIGSSWVVAVGIALVFIATVVGPLVLYGNPY